MFPPCAGLMKSKIGRTRVCGGRCGWDESRGLTRAGRRVKGIPSLVKAPEALRFLVRVGRCDDLAKISLGVTFKASAVPFLVWITARSRRRLVEGNQRPPFA